MTETQIKTFHGKSMDKIRRYGWTVKDKPGSLVWINKALLEIDPSYQRTYILEKARSMASDWSHVACGAIVVGKRNESYFVIDGQHRVLAAQKRSDIIDLPCIVFETGSNKEEACGFLNVNTLRKTVRAIDSFKARLTAEDMDAIYIKRLLEDLGFHITRRRKEPLDFRSIATGLRMLNEDRIRFEQTMKFISILCKDAPVEKRLLEGIFYISRCLKTNLDDPRLRNRMFKIGPEALLKAADRSAAMYARGGPKIYAEGIIGAVNKGLRVPFEFK